jgi:hypothetical protein
MNAITAAAAVSTPLEQFLVYSAALIRTYGYLNAAQAREQSKESTGKLAWIWATKGRANNELQMVKITDEDRWSAKDVAEWMKAITNAGNNEYMVTLFAIGYAGSVVEKHAGFAASAINAYAKRNEKAEDKSDGAVAATVTGTTGHATGYSSKKFYPKSKPSVTSFDPEKFSGKIGDKISLQVEYVKWHNFVGVYGTSNIYTFEDSSGKLLKWFTQKSESELGMKIGDKIVLSGTVKDLEEFRGIFSTVVTRCSIKK